MTKVLAVLAVALTVAVTAVPAGADAPRDQTLYGNIASLKPSGGRYLLRLDPAFWLSGVTASRASAEDGFGAQVDNDYYIRDEGHRLLTYVLPRTARVRVLTGGTAGPIRSTTVTVSELVQLFAGKNPKHRALLGSIRDVGYWVTVRNDIVRAVEAQYRP
jgi:hypothetical protein